MSGGFRKTQRIYKFTYRREGLVSRYLCPSELLVRSLPVPSIAVGDWLGILPQFEVCGVKEEDIVSKHYDYERGMDQENGTEYNS